MPQSLPAWQRAYVGTLQAVRKLDAAYAGMVHPQRGPACRAALEASLGRLVELRAAVDAGTLAAALAASAASAAPVLKKMLDDPHEEVRRAATEALEKIQPTTKPAK